MQSISSRIHRRFPTGIDIGLVAHWQLDGACKDSSGNANHGENYGVQFAADGEVRQAAAAVFNGKDSYIEVPHRDSLGLASEDFSISVWVRTEASLDSVVGDIVSKFDADARRGFILNIKDHAGMTSCQSNFHNVHFGIDNAKIDPEWSDCGRPSNSIFISSMAVHEGGLYVGTLEPGADETGRVYRYACGNEWIDCGKLDGSNTVASMASHNGTLYAATSYTSGSGSALAELPNKTPGGGVYRYEGNAKWASCGRLGNGAGTGALTVFRNQLYAGESTDPGVYRFDGDCNWIHCGAPGGQRTGALGIYHGDLYSACKGSVGVWRYEGGSEWTDCGRPDNEVTVYGFLNYEGELYVGTWENAKIMRYEGGKSWVFCGRPGYNMEIMAIAGYNGKLYAGTLPMGEVYRFERPNLWTRTGWLDRSDAKLRRIWVMAVYDGKLFAGTLPSGRVFSLEAGKIATYDYQLQAGWRHITAVRNADKLLLYIDGKLAARSSEFDAAEYDITNDKPLKIGFGAHDYFNGRMRDLRLYNRALSEQEVGALFAAQ